MERGKAWIAAALVLSLTGCAAGWLNSPSPATENLVHDLKLEGFECTARLSSVLCSQSEAYIERSAMICTSAGGCVKQPCHDIRMVYEIRERENGIPSITQTTERTVTKSIQPSEINSGERLKLLLEYCALDEDPAVGGLEADEPTRQAAVDRG